MYKKIVFLVLFITVVGVSQNTVDVPVQYVNNEINPGSQQVKGNYVGSPYLEKDFTVGKIFLPTGQVLNARMRLNAYSDSFEFYNQGKLRALLKVEGTKVFYKNEKFVLEDLKGNRDNYLVELVGSGKIKFYKKYNMKFAEAKKAESSYGSDKPAKFSLQVNFFVKTSPSNKFKNIRLKKKDILSTMKDNESLIKKYVKVQKLSFSKEKDIIKLFNYYNSL